MANLASSRVFSPAFGLVIKRLALSLVIGTGIFSCSTLHETDLGADRGYGEGMAPAYKPSLSSPNALSRNGKKGEPNYTPMIERTATGVRAVKDFSSQARNKSANDNASQTRAARAQQNSKMAKAYNDNNLLTR